MNEVTLSLARLLGPTLGILGLGMLANADFYSKAYKQFSKEGFVQVAITMAMIPIGIALMTSHFLWGTLAEALVSLVGFGFLAKGIFLALLPKAFNKLVDKIISTKLLMIGGAIWLVGGAYLSWVGFAL